jgi:hypothetical protein
MFSSVHIPPSDGNGYEYMASAFKHMYSVSHIAAFSAKNVVVMTHGVIHVDLKCKKNVK